MGTLYAHKYSKSSYLNINLHGYKLRFLKTTKIGGSKDYRDFRGCFLGGRSA
jgi:hypothetical protein